MSVITCIKCSSRVDTDFDHDCKEDTCEPCQREILEQELIKAALALAEHTEAYAFSVPINNTTPALFVELTEQSSFSLRQQLADMERKLKAAEKDAGRYRWLREGCNDKGSAATFLVENYYGMEWDEKVDRAIEQSKGGDE